MTALKRARALNAAVDLFYEYGYDKTTLDAVAERLGVTKPFIYLHFSSKVDLLADICTRGLSASLEAVDGVKSIEVSPTERLTIPSQRFARCGPRRSSLCGSLVPRSSVSSSIKLARIAPVWSWSQSEACRPS